MLPYFFSEIRTKMLTFSITIGAVIDYSLTPKNRSGLHRKIKSFLNDLGHYL